MIGSIKVEGTVINSILSNNMLIVAYNFQGDFQINFYGIIILKEKFILPKIVKLE